MFKAALFTTAKKWENPNVHPLMNKETKCGIFMYHNNGILFSHKRNEVLTHAMALTNLKHYAK